MSPAKVEGKMGSGVTGRGERPGAVMGTPYQYWGLKAKKRAGGPIESIVPPPPGG